ncbi:MAG: ATP-binding cassette domain-containing protein [Spirochaetales bacterium]|jgi:zinc transport system ATP-binding protein|nr:ATP-binding cassette domain-containing protein [Spirochaetales bacterium]
MLNQVQDNLITAEKVSFGYEGNVVVPNLDFLVQRGDFLWIIGENGSGKTTLVKGLLGLLKPMGGRLTFAGDLRRTEIGYLSQQEAPKKDFPAGVFEVVLSGNLARMGLRPFYSPQEKRRARENMRLLGLEDCRESCYRELSGGQQRRVLLARALCAGEKLLILDEPTSGLDPLITAEVYRLLEKINRERGMTIIMVSHDMPGAERYARRICNLGKPLLDAGGSASAAPGDSPL